MASDPSEDRKAIEPGAEALAKARHIAKQASDWTVTTSVAPGDRLIFVAALLERIQFELRQTYEAPEGV